MARVFLRAKIAVAAIWLLFVPTIAMAEYDVKSALQAHDSADPDNRKVWELIFGNTYSGMRWANSALVSRKQQQLFCEPNNAVLTGPQVAEMLRAQLNADPKFGDLPFGFAILSLHGYLVIMRVGWVLVVGAAGEITNVTQAFQPSGRFSAANSL